MAAMWSNFCGLLRKPELYLDYIKFEFSEKATKKLSIIGQIVELSNENFVDGYGCNLVKHNYHFVYEALWSMERK